MCVCMPVHWENIDHLLPGSCILKYPLFINPIIRSVIYFSFIFIPGEKCCASQRKHKK